MLAQNIRLEIETRLKRIIDTSLLTINQQVEKIFKIIK